MTGSFARAAKNNLIAIGEEGTRLSRRQKDGLGAIASELKQTAGRRFLRAGDGARGKDISDLQVAAIAAVMSDQLSWRPVKITDLRIAEKHWVQLILTHCAC